MWLNSSAPPEPAESCGVKLTLDTFIEYVAESELEKAAQKYNARSAEVVVMDAETLEVLAMTSWPFFDPNIIPEKKDPKEELGRNHAISDAYEPGSTFKVFLMSGALDQNLVRQNDRIFCENGSYKLASHTIKDVHPHGWITMQEVIKYSSNIGAAKIALHMGSEKYSHYIHDFGFGSLTGITLPGEFKGLVTTAKKMETDRPGRNRLWAEHRRNHPSDHKRHCSDSQWRRIRRGDNRQRYSRLAGQFHPAIQIDQNPKSNSKEDSRPGSCYDATGNSGRRYRGKCGTRGLHGRRQDWNGSGNGQDDEALCFEQIYLGFYRVCPGRKAQIGNHRSCPRTPGGWLWWSCSGAGIPGYCRKSPALPGGNAFCTRLRTRSKRPHG